MLFGYYERMTNYADLSFSDEEVMTIYLHGIIEFFFNWINEKTGMKSVTVALCFFLQTLKGEERVWIRYCNFKRWY